MTCYHIIEPKGQTTELFAKDAEAALFRYVSNAAMFEMKEVTFQYNANNSAVIRGVATFTDEICIISQIAPQVYYAAWEDK